MVDSGSLEIFRHALTGIVEEMGVTLQRTAHSTNIKIRRDHTCALFDAAGRHLAQHDVAPQHIGSLVSVVPRLTRERPDLEPGDGLLVNDPYAGAVHLPDVMLVSPLFVDDDLVGYAANSAHHVDIGGPTPGGIPNDSTSLYGEGLVIPGVKAVRDWAYDEELLALVLRNLREPDARRGDLLAQLGANRTGERRYAALVERYGAGAVDDHLEALFDYTERRVRAAIAELPDGTVHAEDALDGDGVVDEPVTIALTVTVDGDEMTLDFAGTAPENEGPLNCTPAMAFAGTMAVVMALLGGDLPKNDGFYRPFEVVTPPGTMVNPSRNRPVAGGWEVAMRAGELVTRAMADAVPERTIAGSKGIVANVAYGGHDPRTERPYVYYETVAGGLGARATKDGLDAVQTGFQNTANSPIEALETELPVVVRRYELVPDSGGPGRTRGGLGVRRDLEFQGEGNRFSLLTDGTRSGPWGLFGGQPGRPARYRVNPDTDPVEVGSKSTTTLAAGEVGSVQTPGGGGYGDPLERDPAAVLEDVRDGKVSVQAAAEAYGVVVVASADDGGVEAATLDPAATRARRAAIRDGRAEPGDDGAGGAG